MSKFVLFLTKDEGMEMGEYALMGALISLTIVAAIAALRDAIANEIARMASVFPR